MRRARKLDRSFLDLVGSSRCHFLTKLAGADRWRNEMDVLVTSYLRRTATACQPAYRVPDQDRSRCD